MTRVLCLDPLRWRARAMPWAGATALVALLHVGAAGLVLARGLASTASEDVTGAEVVIDIAPVVTSAQSEPAAEARDQTAEDRPVTPALDETLSKKQETDLPTEQASPAKPVEEDLRMAQERTRKETEQETSGQATEQSLEQKREAASQASIAAAPADEQIGERRDETAAAPEEGNAAEGRRRIEAWQRALFAQIARHKRYPEAARASRPTGETLVAFHLDRQGRVSQIRVMRSSGAAVLDAAAVTVLERASPLPAPPVQLAGDSLAFTVPMRFATR